MLLPEPLAPTSANEPPRSQLTSKVSRARKGRFGRQLLAPPPSLRAVSAVTSKAELELVLVSPKAVTRTSRYSY